ncbi:MAG: hypothetical protein QMO91_06395 [Candidatus Tisiphia sp.]|nr:hypothetical protein [Candidatus Tisiphia sp.]
MVFKATGTLTGDITGNVFIGEYGTGSIGNITINGEIDGDVLFNTGGTLNANGNIKKNVDFFGKSGTVNLANGCIISKAVYTRDDNTGTLIFLGNGEVIGRISEENPLAAVNFDGDGNVNLTHAANAAKAQTFTFSSTANVTAYGGITGNVHFAANGTLNLADHKRITGAIYNISDIDNQGILTFVRNGKVTGNIGANGYALAEIKVGVGNVKLKGNVFTKKLNFVANKTVTIGGDFTGGVDFGAGGRLTFNKLVVPGKPATFNSTIANGEHGTLNVKTNLIATNADIGKIKTINIGTKKARKKLTIDASNANVILLRTKQVINFIHPKARLTLRNSSDQNRMITLDDNLDPGTNDTNSRN